MVRIILLTPYHHIVYAIAAACLRIPVPKGAKASKLSPMRPSTTLKVLSISKHNKFISNINKTQFKLSTRESGSDKLCELYCTYYTLVSLDGIDKIEG